MSNEAGLVQVLAPSSPYAHVNAHGQTALMLAEEHGEDCEVAVYLRSLAPPNADVPEIEEAESEDMAIEEVVSEEDESPGYDRQSTAAASDESNHFTQLVTA
jgi:hypothetical protein